MSRTFVVYRITNRANGKVYIGKTHNLYKRWREHVGAASRGALFLLQRAIRKYSEYGFTILPLSSHKDEQAAFDAESAQVAAHRSNIVELGYNMTNGGDGVVGTLCKELNERRSAAARKRCEKPMSQEQRAKISKSLTGRKWSDETRAKIIPYRRAFRHSEESKERIRASLMGHAVSDETRAKCRAANVGRQPSEETRAKLRAAQANRPPPKPVSEVTRAKIRAAHLGSKHSAEHKAKIGNALRGRRGKPMTEEHRTMLVAINTGRKASDETKAKMSAARRGRKMTDEARANIRAGWVKRKAAMAEKVSNCL